MNCKKTQPMIQDFVDGALAAGDRDRVQAHVDHCPRCAADLRSFRTMVLALSAMELEAVPPKFADRVIARLRVARNVVEPAVSAARRAGFLDWLRAPLRVPLATAILVLFAMALFPVSIGLLEGFVGKSTVFVTNTYIELEDKAGGVELVSRMIDNLERNIRTVKTVLLAAFSLLARAGEVYMLPALAMLFTIVLGVLLYLRVTQRRGAPHALLSV